MMQQTLNPTNNTQQMMNNMQATDTLHGGHELMDVHEILGCLNGTLDQYLLYDQHIKDPELKDILNRQHQFMLDNYNILCECFKSGKDPSHPTTKYMMNQSNDVIYGLKPGQPKTPHTNASQIGDKCISNYMMGLIKSSAGVMTMGALEVTNPVVRRVIADSVPNFIEMAYEIFQYQNKHGYYQVARLDQNDMTQLINSYAPATGQQLQ
jgi:spore coat protein CotF